MILHKTLGYYIPSFFLLHINSDEVIEKIFNSTNERILVHELIHFMQDVSTTYGLINLSKTVDLIKDQNKILRNSSVPISIPFSANLYSSSVMVNKDLFSIYLGDGAEKFTVLQKGIKVSRIDEKELNVDNFKEKIKSIKLILSINNKDMHNFYFGAASILESMANLIENSIYGKISSNLTFPYDIASLIAQHIYPELAENEMAIIELCEASLMIYHPSLTFLESLKQMHKKKYLQKSPNDTYKFVLQNIKLISDDGEISLLKEYEKQAKFAIKQIDSLFTVKPLSEDKWGSEMLQRAFECKENEESISSIILGQSLDSMRNNLFDLLYKVGFPIASNNKKNIYWTQKSANKNYTTHLYYLAILTFNNIFSFNNTKCELFDYCKSVLKPNNTNNNCLLSPWNQLNDGINCHFSQIWKMWGLKDVRINIST